MTNIPSLMSRTFNSSAGCLEVHLRPCGAAVDPWYVLDGTEHGWLMPEVSPELSGEVLLWVEKSKPLCCDQAVDLARQFFSGLAPEGVAVPAYDSNSSWSDNLCYVYWDEKSLKYRGYIWFLERDLPMVKINTGSIGYGQEFKRFVQGHLTDLPVVGSTLGGGCSSVVLISDQIWQAIEAEYRRRRRMHRRQDLTEKLTELRQYLAILPPLEDLPSADEVVQEARGHIAFINEEGEGFCPSVPSKQSRLWAEAEQLKIQSEIESLGEGS